MRFSRESCTLDYYDVPFRIRKHGNTAMVIGITLTHSITIGTCFDEERTAHENGKSFQ
jgi:hypothetical protein